MDWDRAIERNREALAGIVSGLMALLVAARFGGVGLVVPRAVWRAVLIVLRPAEAAVRRLVVIAARGLAPIPAAPRPASFGFIGFNPVPLAPAFALFDPLKAFPPVDGTGAARGADFGAAAGPCDRPVDAAALHLRLRALRRALADLARQARRLARWQGRRDAARKACLPVRRSPLRPGLPPGWRQRPSHAVDPVLKECHLLAKNLPGAPNTS